MSKPLGADRFCVFLTCAGRRLVTEVSKRPDPFAGGGVQHGWAPRIKDIKDRMLYKLDRQQHYANLDPILSGTSGLAVLHNTVVAWNLIQLGEIVGQIRLKTRD